MCMIIHSFAFYSWGIETTPKPGFTFYLIIESVVLGRARARRFVARGEL